MDKLIFKTALKTVILVLVLVILTVCLITVFSPMTLAKFNKKLGNNNLAASYTIIEYNRQKDINDLADIVELSILAKNNKRVLKYSELLISHTKFDKYCDFIDSKNNNNNIYASYRQYIYGWNIRAEYMNGDKDSALEKAKSVMPDDYSINNCMQYLVSVVIENNDIEFAKKILFVLQDDIISGIDDEEQFKAAEKRLLDDKTALENILI